LVVSFAAAANFMTPHGYQTNLMVYGPGGYTFSDFFKIGFPLTMIYMVVTVIILRIVYL
jgi:di/tricarboxylate transporter